MGNCLNQCYRFWPCRKDGARLSVNFVPTTEPFVAQDQFQMILAGHHPSTGSYAKLTNPSQSGKKRGGSYVAGMVAQSRYSKHKNLSSILKPRRAQSLKPKRRSTIVKRNVTTAQQPYNSYDDIFLGLSNISKYDNLENDDLNTVLIEPDPVLLEPSSLITSYSPGKSTSFSDLSDINTHIENWGSKFDKMSPYTQYLDISGLTDLADDSLNQSTKPSNSTLKNWYVLPRYEPKSIPNLKSRETSPGSNASQESNGLKKKMIKKRQLKHISANISRAQGSLKNPRHLRDLADNRDSTNGSTTYSPIHNTNGANTSNNLSELEWETESLSLIQ